MDDDIARAARAKKGSPFLSTEQAAFYLGLSAARASGSSIRLLTIDRIHAFDAMPVTPLGTRSGMPG